MSINVTYGRCRQVTGKNIFLERKEMVRWSCGENENEERGAVKMEKKDGVNWVAVVDEKKNSPTFHQQLWCTFHCACFVANLARVNPTLQSPDWVELYRGRIFLQSNRTWWPSDEFHVILEPFHHKWRCSFKDTSEEYSRLWDNSLSLRLFYKSWWH